MSAVEIAAVISDLRDLWEGCDEGAGVRSVASALADALESKGNGFDREAFWALCGFRLR